MTLEYVENMLVKSIFQKIAPKCTSLFSSKNVLTFSDDGPSTSSATFTQSRRSKSRTANESKRRLDHEDSLQTVTDTNLSRKNKNSSENSSKPLTIEIENFRPVQTIKC